VSKTLRMYICHKFRLWPHYVVRSRQPNDWLKCLCGGCKMSPRTLSLCSHIFLVLRDHWLYVCLHLKMEFRSCARGRQWCGIFHYRWWTASIKPRLLFSHSGIVSWGLPFLQFKKKNEFLILQFDLIINMESKYQIAFLPLRSISCGWVFSAILSLITISTLRQLWQLRHI